MESRKALHSTVISDAIAIALCFALTSTAAVRVRCFVQAMCTVLIAGKSCLNRLFDGMKIRKSGSTFVVMLHMRNPRSMNTCLNLNNTYYRNEPGLPEPPGLVDSYMDRYGDGMLENYSKEFNYMYNTAGIGHSGIIATVNDYARFIEALFNGELISQDTLEEMKEWAFPGVSYGLGLDVMQPSFDMGYGFSFGHQGRTFAAMSDMFYFPDFGVTIVY